MKTLRTSFPANVITSPKSFCWLAVALLSAGLVKGQSSSDQVFTGNVDVNKGLSVQQDTDLRAVTFFGSLPQNPLLEGFHVDVVQSNFSMPVRVWVPAHTDELTMVTESFDKNVKPGTFSVPDYGWVNQPQRWHGATYDSNGTLLADEWLENVQPIWGITGYHTLTRNATSYGISGTRAVTFPADQAAHFETLRLPGYNAPRLQFTATRSDAAWVWRAPYRQYWQSTTDTAGFPADIMVLTSGGLLLPHNEYASGYNFSGMLISGDSIKSSIEREDDDVNSRSSFSAGIGGVEFKFQGGSNNGYSDDSQAHLNANTLLISRSESTTGTAVTQIAAKSAHFGGVVSVEGVLRVNPAGDLGMGQFHHGMKPNGDVDPGN